MSIDYTYDKEKNTVNCVVEDLFTSEQLVDYFVRIASDEDISQGFLEIVTLEPDDMMLKHSDLDKIADKASGWAEKGHSHTLMCTFSEKSKEMAVMLMPVFQKVSTNVDVLLCNTENELKMTLESLLSSE